jgi:hypothetical protein
MLTDSQRQKDVVHRFQVLVGLCSPAAAGRLEIRHMDWPEARLLDRAGP